MYELTDPLAIFSSRNASIIDIVRFMNESSIKAGGFTAALVRAKTVNALANTSILHCLIKYEAKRKNKRKKNFFLNKMKR